jgi:hypothetical protein
MRDVEESLEALSLCHADFISADVPEADLRALADIAPGSKSKARPGVNWQPKRLSAGLSGQMRAAGRTVPDHTDGHPHR